MRVSKQVMEKNNSKIIKHAAFLFREKGIDATSVTDVMEAAGLTHGGFYRHFESKDELVKTAIKKAFSDFGESLEKNIEKYDAKSALTDYVHQYLSKKHVTRPGIGCPIASLGIEADRKSAQCKEVMADGSQHLIQLFMKGIKGSQEEKHYKASGLLSLLVGTIVLARASKNNVEVNHILSSSNRLAELIID